MFLASCFLAGLLALFWRVVFWLDLTGPCKIWQDFWPAPNKFLATFLAIFIAIPSQTSTDFWLYFWQIVFWLDSDKPCQISGNVSGKFSGSAWPDFLQHFWRVFWAGLTKHSQIYGYVSGKFFGQSAQISGHISAIFFWLQLARLVATFLASFLAKPGQISGEFCGLT